MKNKGVIISILLIICLGIFVTTSTRRFISNDQSSSDIYKNQTFASAKNDVLASSAEQRMAEEKSTEEKPANTEAASDVPMAISHSSEGAVAAPAAIEEQETTVSSKESLIVISPLTGIRNSVEDQTTVVLSAEDYKKKLQEIDNQIVKMKDSGIEPNTDSYKNMAEYEYRMWDNELNSVYQGILNTMLDEEADILRSEEREWVKERDIAAHKAISKYNGGTIESLEYTASLADSTRTRVYFLVESYTDYLNQTALKITE